MGHPLERRYGGLSAYLTACAARGETRVTLAFAVIETTLFGRPLPATARHPIGHRQWWRTDTPHCPHGWYGWQRVGWTVVAVDHGGGDGHTSPGPPGSPVKLVLQVPQ